MERLTGVLALGLAAFVAYVFVTGLSEEAAARVVVLIVRRWVTAAHLWQVAQVEVDRLKPRAGVGA